MLTSAQWEVVLPILKKAHDNRRKKNGRPFIHSEQQIMEAVLWILKTGARWQDLPEKFPPYTTAYQRFRTWERKGLIRKVLKTLAQDLKQRGSLDVSECYIDATFIPAKKGDSVLVSPSVGRVRNSWQLRTALLFQYPYTRHLLNPTNPNLSKKHFDTPW